jgi:hypothetical protein
MSGSKVIITADEAQAVRAFDRFRAEATGSLGKVADAGGKLKGLLATVGVGLSVAALTGVVNSSIEAAAGMHDLSIQTGASVASLMAFKSVASTSETTLDGIGAAMNKMAKGMSVANEESAGVGAAVRALGLDFAALKNEKPDQQMLDVADALDKFQDGAGKSAVAMTLFGKEGAKMLPFLADLADESEAVRAKLTDQQVQMKAAQAAMADDFSDNLTKIKKSGESWKKDVSMGMLPALYELSGAFYEVTNQAGGFKDHVTQLAQDGTFANWTRAAITGVTYLADAAEGTYRVVKAIGITLAAMWAGTIEGVGGVAHAMSQFVHGDFAAAWTTIKATGSGAAAIGKDLMADLTATFSEQSFGSKIRDRMDEIRNMGAAAKEAKSALDFDASGDANAAAAAKKEAEAFAGLIATIRTKRDEDKLELATAETATEGQKLRIKVEQELASGKLKLSEAHLLVVHAALDELDATEQLVKAQKGEKDVAAWLRESAQARSASSDTLSVEYALYGKTADAREIAMVAVKNETELEKFLLEERKKGIAISGAQLAQLRAEKDTRTAVEQATLAQTKALGYANSLAQENRRFAAESIVDEKQRARALLEIDADTWRQRIQLAGDGTLAQIRLQEQFDQWYANQSIKPRQEQERQLWDGIENAAHDTFLSIENGAKSAGDRAKEALKNGLFEWLWQLAAKPIYLDVRAAFSSGGSAILGTGSDALGSAAGTSGASSGNPLISAASAASALYKAVSVGFDGLADAVAGGVQTAMSAAGYTPLASQGLATASGQALTPLASMAGTAASYGAGLLGGHFIGNAIAGDYSVNHGQAVTNIAAVVGSVLGGPIGGVIGGAIGGLINHAFGMGSTQVQAQGLRGTLSDAGLSAANYQKLHQNGGWFRSDKDWESTTPASAELSAQLMQGLAAIKGASAGFASAVGASADALQGYAKTFDLVLTGDAAKDQQVFADLLTGIGDEIANKLVPNLADFTTSGESASATLQRLAGDFQATNQMAQLLGKSASAVFGSLGMASAAARERLVDLFGGAQSLTQLAGSYAQNFLSDAERLQPVREAVDAAMASLGLAAVQTRAQFKAIVAGLDLTTEAGAKEFASLMNLADAFAQVHPAIQSTTDALQAMKDAASAALGEVDSKFAVLQKVVDREKAALQVRIDAEAAAIGKLQSLSQALHGTLDALKGPDQAAYDRLVAQGQVKAALAIAKAGGPLPAADSLKGALSALQQDASGQFATYADYLNDFYSTKNDIAELAGITDDSLSVEQKTLDALNQQVKQYDAMLASEQAQIEELKGQSTTQLSILQALAGIQSAILAAQANPVVAAGQAVNQAYQSALGRTPDAAGLAYWQQQAASGTPISDIIGAIGNSPEATIRGMYQTMLHRDPDAAGMNFWMNQVGNGVSLASISDELAGSDEAKRRAGIPGYAKGGENGPELEATGPARIFNASQTAGILSRLASPADNNAALLQEIKSLRTEVALLRRDNSAENLSIAKHSMNAANALDDAVSGARPLLTKAGT